ncbi:MAG: CARDB domain-containing protein [Acidobacteriota bacterium]
MRRGRAVILVLVFVAGCGRSPALPGASDGGSQPPDRFTAELPPGRPDVYPPPGDFRPPPGDFWPPPPGDFWPPPPPGDFWPPPPPGDFWPPPPPGDFGPPPALPDLVVSSFTAKVTGTTVTYSVVTCNKGQGSAGSFYVDVYYNRSAAPGVGDFGELYQDYPGLAAGACLTTTLTRTGTPSGSYASWAQVDADGVIGESIEVNNVSGPVQVVVGGPPPAGIDLVLTSLKATVSGTIASVTYQMQVCNQGTAASPATEAHVFYNLSGAPPAGQKGDATTNVPALQPGSCTNRSVVRSGVPPGSYSSYARVDPLNVVAESNESNNTFGPLVVTVGTAAGADLSIKSFSSQVIGQTTVRYQLQVCNGGTGASGATTVHAYYNRGTAPTAGLSGDQLAAVPNLAPGACSTQNLYRYGTPPGSYTSWAQVDPQNGVQETNETNNVAGPLTVTVSGPSQQANLALTQFTAQVTGTTINFATTVCNSGTVAAANFRLDLYYNRTTAPKVGDLGDVYDLIPQLAAGACTVRNRSATNLKAGVYTSWAQVDTTNTVSESNEQNNTAGPRVSVIAGPVVDCTAICALAVSCGLFTATQLAQCASWCANLPTTAKQCASAAVQSGGCTALKACNLPPPPPPPPPPGVCPDLCSYLISPCSLLPSSQYWACVGACENLAPDRLQCAQDAKAKGQCMQVVTCLF